MKLSSLLVETIGWTLVQFLWQAALIAVLLWIFLRLARRPSPQLRYAASTGALLLMLFTAAGTACVTWRVKQADERAPADNLAAPAANAALSDASQSYPVPAAPVVEAALPDTPPLPPYPPPATPAEMLRPVPDPPESPGMERFRPLLPQIVAIWAAGVVLCSLRMAGGWFILRRWTLQSSAPPSGEWSARFADVCRRLCVTRPVRLLSSAAVRVPLAAGWLRPVILVPASLFTSLTPLQLEAIIAHELAHIRRLDYLINLLQCAVETLFFFHPAIWWVSAQMRHEREHCCDDIAVEYCGSRLAYARTLTLLEELRPGIPAPAAGSGSLLRRIRTLAGTEEKRAAAWPLAILAASLAALLPWLKAAEPADRQPPPAPESPEPPPTLLPFTAWSGLGKTGPESLSPEIAAALNGTRITLGGGCVEMAGGPGPDGYFTFRFPKQAQSTGINTSGDHMAFTTGFRPQRITHFVIEIAPGPFEINELVASLDGGAGSAELSFNSEPFHSANADAQHPAAAAIDGRPSTSWRPSDPTKPSVAVFTLSTPLNKQYQFLCGGRFHYQLGLKFQNSGSQPLKIRATAISVPDDGAKVTDPFLQTAEETFSLTPEGQLVSGDVPLNTEALAARFQAIAASSPHRLVRVNPEPAGRFRNIAPILDAASSAGLTNLLFQPRSLQGVSDEKPHPPVETLVNAILEIQKKSGTPWQSLMQLLAVQGWRFDKDPFADIFKKHTLRKTWERLETQTAWTTEEARAVMHEIYAQHPAPLLWLELALQMREWSDRNIISGSPAGEDTLKLAFGPPLPGGLRVAVSSPAPGARFHAGELLPVHFVFHNAGSQPVDFLSDTWRQWDSWQFPKADGTFASAGWGGIQGASIQRRFRLSPGEAVKIARPPLTLQLAPGNDYSPRWVLRINDTWATSPDLKPLELSTAAVNFHVDFAAESTAPAAVVSAPGNYSLAPGITLRISRTETADGSLQNEGTIEWWRTEGFAVTGGETLRRHTVTLPQGVNTWRIAWPVNSGVIWIAEDGQLRTLDFSKQSTPEERSLPFPGINEIRRLSDEQLAEAIRGRIALKSVEPEHAPSTPPTSNSSEKPREHVAVISGDSAQTESPAHPPATDSGRHQIIHWTGTIPDEAELRRDLHFERLAYGPPGSTGLRAALLLSPRRNYYVTGEPLRCYFVFHNSGDQPVSMSAEAWHRDNHWTVKDAKGRNIEIKSTPLPTPNSFLLKAGEFGVISAAGLAAGTSARQEASAPDGNRTVFPAMPGDELSCAASLQITLSATGPATLTTGEVNFKVITGDPGAIPGIGTATDPGTYALAEGIRLKVSRKAAGDPPVYTNRATIEWLDAGGNPLREQSFDLPPGHEIQSIIWQRGSSILHTIDSQTVRRIDFGDATTIKEDHYKPGDAGNYGGATGELLKAIQDAATATKTLQDTVAVPAPQKEGAKPTEVVINVSGDGSFDLKGKPVTQEELTTELAEIAKTNRRQTIIIRGETTTPYEKIISVLNLTHKSGLYHVSFAATLPAEPEPVVNARALFEKARNEAKKAEAASEPAARKSACDAGTAFYAGGIKELLKFDAANKNSVPGRTLLAKGYLEFGQLLAFANSPGDAQVAYSESIRVFIELLKEFPADAELKSNLAEAYLNVAELMQTTEPGSSPQTAELVNQALELIQALLAESPENAGIKPLLERAQKTRANLPASPSPSDPKTVPVSEPKKSGGFFKQGNKSAEGEPLQITHHRDGSYTESRRKTDDTLEESTFDKSGALKFKRVFLCDSRGRPRRSFSTDSSGNPLHSTEFGYAGDAQTPSEERTYNAAGRLIRRLFYPGALKDPQYSNRFVAFQYDPNNPKAPPVEDSSEISPICPAVPNAGSGEPLNDNRRIKLWSLAIPAKTAAASETDQLALMQQLRQSLLEGADGAALARQYSTDSKQENGGNWGFVGKSDLTEPFWKEVAALPRNLLSEIKPMAGNLYLFRVEADSAGLDRLIRLGTGYYDLGQYRKAEEQFDSALRMDPENPALLRQLEKIREKLRQSSPASAEPPASSATPPRIR